MDDETWFSELLGLMLGAVYVGAFAAGVGAAIYATPGWWRLLFVPGLILLGLLWRSMWRG